MRRRIVILLGTISIAGVYAKQRPSNQRPSSHSSTRLITRQKAAIQQFQSDFTLLQNAPVSSINTPCYQIQKLRDSTYTKLWSFDDWERHQRQSIFRYIRHIKTWPRSTTVHNILPTIAAEIIWCIFVFRLTQRGEQSMTPGLSSKYAVTLTFMQAPILLLLTLRTNRALDRMLESRTAWGALSRTTKSLMGLICAYIMPQQPETAMIMARYLTFIGWSLKGMLRKDDHDEYMMDIFTSVPMEKEWLLQTPGKRPMAIVARLRYMMAELGKHSSSHSSLLPPVILHRMESILYDIESSIGTCARLASSPIPPTYTRHTSRVLVCYMFLLPFALCKCISVCHTYGSIKMYMVVSNLNSSNNINTFIYTFSPVGMGSALSSAVITATFTSYVLVGIDEIGLEIEMPFNLLPMYDLCSAIQNDIVRQVVQYDDMAMLKASML